MKKYFQRLARFPIGIQVGFAVVATLATLLLANGAAWVSMRTVSSSQAQLIETQIPLQANALQLMSQATNLSPILSGLASSLDREVLQTRFDEYLIQEQELDHTLDTLLALMHGDHSNVDLRESISRQVTDLVLRGTQLYDWNSQRIETSDALDRILKRVKEIEFEVLQLVATDLDDQVFFVVTGYRSIDDVPAAMERRAQSSELGALNKLATMRNAILQVSGVLTTMISAKDVSHLQLLTEQMDAALTHLEAGTPSIGSPANRERILNRTEELSRLVNGAHGVLALVRRHQLQNRELTRTSKEGRVIARDLLANIDTLVVEVKSRARASMNQANNAITRSYLLIGGLALASLILAGLYVWGYVQPVLTGRLVQLAELMRRMARDQDLAIPVEVYGKDEVAQMGQDLEIFRQHTLDAQRLGVVEKMAAELESKNNDLEETIQQLAQAQEQIILREKLAALGELTAGVAHEIKNPLNFVNNFSATSVELCEELQGLLLAPQFENAEWREDVEDLVQVIQENMGRINGHGKRADRIVNSMLSLGRSADAEATTVDLTPLVKEHAELAWHSVRVSIAGFDAPIRYEFPEEPLDVLIRVQDISRVILNLVSNACHACKSRQDMSEVGYQPEIAIRGYFNDNMVCLDVMDNGTGMSPEIQEQIFIPFFTTKPTDVGTGLGLSMSYDIVQQHKGELSVVSEPDRGTTFSVKLPA